MRPSHLRITTAAVIPLVLLAACSSVPAALDLPTVGGTATAPTLNFKTMPISVEATTTKVVTAGKGERLSKANLVTFNYGMFNGNDGKELDSSFGKKPLHWDLGSADLMPGVGKGLIGQQVGSRLLVAVPPAEAFSSHGGKGDARLGVRPTDSIVFLIDLLSAVMPLPTASGAPVSPKAGLPTVTVDGAKVALITVPKTTAPAKLVVQPLITGTGRVVTAGQTIKVNYTGVLWKDGKKFDASADHGGPWSTPIGVRKAVPGWDKGLVGQTVGSRILLILPSADGYGAEGRGPVGGKDTLVYVVDILAAC